MMAAIVYFSFLCDIYVYANASIFRRYLATLIHEHTPHDVTVRSLKSVIRVFIDAAIDKNTTLASSLAPYKVPTSLYRAMTLSLTYWKDLAKGKDDDLQMTSKYLEASRTYLRHEEKENEWKPKSKRTSSDKEGAISALIGNIRDKQPANAASRRKREILKNFGLDYQGNQLKRKKRMTSIEIAMATVGSMVGVVYVTVTIAMIRRKRKMKKEWTNAWMKQSRNARPRSGDKAGDSPENVVEFASEMGFDNDE
ncbi:hypothetical protein DdX_12743 [Ditylenchus destructor]|uniref:Uncharacterized protein n=1 Tax=Ditylenchus destructor TaxID=166010 RepID=A0AAD4R067_9BILA|nr:hypothetical protein DdX_12743 [Ditylenchus destructor]